MLFWSFGLVCNSPVQGQVVTTISGSAWPDHSREGSIVRGLSFLPHFSFTLFLLTYLYEVWTDSPTPTRTSKTHLSLLGTS
ncbi:hypothetical protein N7534_000732 [Penicillium rubens]|nr:hypothetical protein N7534_000732 [Penicillium rubens]